MYPLSVAIAVLFQAIPGEYVLDYGLGAIPVTSNLTVLLEAKDGTRFRINGLEVSRGADAEVFWDLMLSVAKDNPKWLIRKGSGTTVIVSGTKTSGIRSVTITSDGWKPEVRWRPLSPPKKK